MSGSDVSVMTVLGPIAPDALGLTSMHEHVLCDTSAYRAVYPPADSEQPAGDLPFDPSMRGTLEQQGFFRSLENCRLDDRETMTQEVRWFADSGGAAMLELSCSGLRVDVEGLREVAQRTGVAIVASTGLYIEPSWPETLRAADVDQLTEHMIGELRDGIGDSGIRAGHIGEIGITDLSAAQERVLVAAAQAAAATGVSITVHPGFGIGSDGRRVLALLTRHGVDPSRVVLAHGDAFFVEHGLRDLVQRPESRGLSVRYHEEVLAAGATISVDCFGHAWSLLARDWVIESDWQRLAGLVELIRRGHSEQLVLGTDICFRLLTRAGGGHGYAWLTEFVLPFLRGLEVSDHDIRSMVHANPARLLTPVPVAA